MEVTRNRFEESNPIQVDSLPDFNLPMVPSFKEAMDSLQSEITDLDKYHSKSREFAATGVWKHNLTEDEVAAINIYTQEWIPRENSLYYILNQRLREPNRSNLGPFLPYLSLLYQALSHLHPFQCDKQLWRSLKVKKMEKIEKDTTLQWGGFSSCSVNMEKVAGFLELTGERVLFSIRSNNAVSIKDYSCFPDEDEVLLRPGTCLVVHGVLDAGHQLTIVELQEINTKLPNSTPKSSIPKGEVELQENNTKLPNIPPKSSIPKGEVELQENNANLPDLTPQSTIQKTLNKNMICIKTVIVGNSGCGKTSITFRYCKDDFTEGPEQTIGASFVTKKQVLKDHTMKFDIWDTAGHASYFDLSPVYLKHADCVICVYDITNRDSFDVISFKWLRQIQKCCTPWTVVVIIGNKLDLEYERKVLRDEGKMLASKVGAMFTEVSCKDGTNVAEFMLKLAMRLSTRLEIISERSKTIILESANVDKKRKCDCK